MLPFLRKSIACLLLTDGAFRRSITCSISLLQLFSTSNKGDSVTSPAILDLLLHKYQFSPQSATESAAIINRLKYPAKSELVLSSFKDYGFSNAQLEKLVKVKSYRRLLLSRPDTIKRKFEVLRNLGLHADDIVKLIPRNYSIMLLNLNHRVIPSFSWLESLLGTTDAVVKLWLKSPWLLTCDMGSRLVPNMEFLKTYGISDENVLKFLCNKPRCFLLKPGIFKKSVERAEEMGAIRSSDMFIHAIKKISSYSEEAWELKLQSFRNCGFSASDITSMFRKAPQMFSVSEEKLQHVIGFLLATGKYSLSSIVNNPKSLACSIEDRFKPRLKALEMLECRKLIKSWPGLSAVANTPDEKFFEKYVAPYLDDVDEHTLQRVMTRA